jgi:uncharacterized membrane protein
VPEVTRVGQRPHAAGPGPYLLAAVVLGVGLGGFVDGIVFHQVLQWHHMVSAADPPVTIDALRLNTLMDGLFHAAAWVVTLAGVVLLWRSAVIAGTRPPFRLLLGGLVVGFAAFNLVEGLVNHHLLGLHHVRDGPDAFVYDAGFLVVSALLFVLGSALVRRASVPRPTGSDQAHQG